MSNAALSFLEPSDHPRKRKAGRLRKKKRAEDYWTTTAEELGMRIEHFSTRKRTIARLHKVAKALAHTKSVADALKHSAGSVSKIERRRIKTALAVLIMRAPLHASESVDRQKDIAALAVWLDEKSFTPRYKSRVWETHEKNFYRSYLAELLALWEEESASVP